MKNININYLLLIAFLLTSCLEDNPSLIVTTDLGNGAIILKYLEAKGDFVNTSDLPGTIEAENVFINLDKYLILDIRDSIHFKNGHIPGAVSVHHSKLADLIETNKNSFEKFVIASYTGQSACFYSTLLRYLGYSNVYSLKFGMASWHRDFADYWIEVIQNNYQLELQNDKPFLHPKPALTHLPEISFDNEISDSAIIARINLLLEQPFDDIANSSYESPFVAGIQGNSNDKLIVCYSLAQIYYSQKYSMQGIVVPYGVEQSHIKNSVQYLSSPAYELRSQYYLQTLPPNQPIEIYSSNGFESACATAYLSILGYNVKSKLFGASYFNYYNMTFVPGSEEYLFSGSDIKNYEYANE